MDTSQINSYIFTGWKDRFWYNQCEQTFREIFKPRGHCTHTVAKLFAATSINTSLRSNITLFRKALYEIENDLPVGNYLPNIQKQLLSIRSGGDLSGRKIRSFASAMCGDPDAVVVDIWLLRCFDMERHYFRQTKGEEKGRGRIRSAGATDKDYTMIESWVRNEANGLGIQPAQLSAILWSGCRIQQGGDTETHYTTLLKQSFTNLFDVI